MEQREKGTVTSLASLISVEEAQKAAKRVEGSVAEHQKELLDHIRHFISDNNNLINLVHKLPDELHHDIMVPFGKAAFFLGRLIHTNEFTVLLGEGYYVQRTSKQTVGILQRRGKVLDSQVESLKAMMLDLKAEASFFGSTAAEASEGVVEIREEYEEHPTERMSNKADLEKPDTSSSSEVHNVEVAGEDKEYVRIMSRLNQLEKEELEAEHVDEDTDFGCSVNEHSFEQLKISEGHQHEKSSLKQNSRSSSQYQQNSADRSTVENSTVQQLPEDNCLHRENLSQKGTSTLQSHCNLKRRNLK